MTLNDLIRKAGEAARSLSSGDVDLMILDAITADAHGRKVKDIHIDPYSENGEIKVAVMFEEEEQKTDLPRYYGD